MAQVIPFLSICPRMRVEQDMLVAETSLLLQVALLGLKYRRVIVDPQTQTLTIERRFFWWFKQQRQISFREIAAITYGYEDVAWMGFFSWAHDSLDLFAVGLRLHLNRDEFILFYFFGEGTFTNNGPLSDWWYWKEYMTDMSGTQESESRCFAEWLSKLVGAQLAPSTLVAESF